MEKLSLPATILIASIILGGSYYLVQINKQKSVENQQQIELQAKIESDQAKANINLTKQADLSNCLNKADIDYADYVRLNGTTRTDGSFWASSLVYDRADKERQTAINYCSLQYK